MELKLFSRLKKTKLLKNDQRALFPENTKLSEDTIEDEKAYTLRRGALLQ